MSLALVLGAVFVAFLCDFLKGNNEALRERNIELVVRQEERQRSKAELSAARNETIQKESSAALSAPPRFVAPPVPQPVEEPGAGELPPPVAEEPIPEQWATEGELAEVDSIAGRILRDARPSVAETRPVWRREAAAESTPEPVVDLEHIAVVEETPAAAEPLDAAVAAFEEPEVAEPVVESSIPDDLIARMQAAVSAPHVETTTEAETSPALDEQNPVTEQEEETQEAPAVEAGELPAEEPVADSVSEEAGEELPEIVISETIIPETVIEEVAEEAVEEAEEQPEEVVEQTEEAVEQSEEVAEQPPAPIEEVAEEAEEQSEETQFFARPEAPEAEETEETAAGETADEQTVTELPEVAPEEEPEAEEPAAEQPAAEEPRFTLHAKVTPIDVIAAERTAADEALKLARELARVAELSGVDGLEDAIREAEETPLSPPEETAYLEEPEDELDLEALDFVEQVEDEVAREPVVTTNEEYFRAETPAVTEPEEEAEPVEALAEERDDLSITMPEPPPAEAPITNPIRVPTGYQDYSVLAEAIESEALFRGTVVSLTAVGAEGEFRGKRLGAVIEFVTSLLTPSDFACQSSGDEFLLILPGEIGAPAQRRLQYISQRLWDYQIRSVGADTAMFSWGASENAAEPLRNAISSARDRMLETRRNRQRATSEIHSYHLRAAND